MVALIVNFVWKLSEIRERGDAGTDYIMFQQVGR